MSNNQRIKMNRNYLTGYSVQGIPMAGLAEI